MIMNLSINLILISTLKTGFVVQIQIMLYYILLNFIVSSSICSSDPILDS